MTVMTDKITDTVAARLGAARQLIDAKVKPYADASGRRAARQAAADQAARQLQLARALMQERVVPTVQHHVIPVASSALDNARVATAPARKEAARRALLAAAALRGTESIVVVKKRRRWPMAVGCLVLGGAVGAAAAWLSQAGKPMQLTPYPVPSGNADSTVDLDAEERSRHTS